MHNVLSSARDNTDPVNLANCDSWFGDWYCLCSIRTAKASTQYDNSAMTDGIGLTKWFAKQLPHRAIDNLLIIQRIESNDACGGFGNYSTESIFLLSLLQKPITYIQTKAITGRMPCMHVPIREELLIIIKLVMWN